MTKRCIFVFTLITLLAGSLPCFCQVAGARLEKIIIDTDIGDDIDDAFAVALALKSPELRLLGISTTFGDTEARAKIVDRLLGEAGRQDIPVAVGVPTKTNNPMSQRR